MASPAVDPPISGHLRAEALPVIDLRLLTQSELHALSLISASSTVDLRRCDDVVVPTIDRSVFNESAGSRKQTYSRLRLAPRKPHNGPSSSSSSSNTIPRPIHPRSHPMNGVESEENRKIVSMLKGLLSGEGIQYGNGNALDPVRVEYSGAAVPNSSNGVLEQVTVNVDAGDGMKKRRGRKASNEMSIVLYESPAISNEDRDKELMNENGVLVDLSALASLEDPYGPELRRNTEGMNTDEELLGFITGLDGQWGSRRKRRKTVEASGFGDALPKGWKLLLSIKKKDGLAWISIRRYISPSGREFVSCKEISSYLQSLLEPPKASVADRNDESNPLACEVPSVNEAVFTANGNIESNNISSLTPDAIASLATDCKNQVALLREGQIQVQGTFSCHKCAALFEEEDDLLHHLLSAHIKSGKRRRLGTSVTDGVIIKDGVFECQFCHKIFHEKHRYNGHVGNHVKNYVKNLEASSGVMSTPLSIEHVSVGGSLPGVDEMQATFSSCIDVVAEPYISKVNEGPSSGACDIPVNLISDSCTQKNQECFPIDQPEKKRKRKKKTMDKESSDNTGKKHKGHDNKQQRVDESDIVAEAQLTCSLTVERLLVKNENNNIQNFDEPNSIKLSSDKVPLEQKSDYSLLAFSGSGNTFLAEDNLNGPSLSSMEAPKQDLGSERAFDVLNVNERIFGTEDISDSIINSATEEQKFAGPEQIVNDEPSIFVGNSYDEPDENVASAFKQQGGCDVFPFDSCVTELKGDAINNKNRITTSTVAESKEESSERGLTTPPYNGQSSGVDNTMNRAHISTFDEADFEMDERGLSTSSYDVQTSGFNINTNNLHSSQLDESNFDAVERGSPYDGPSIGFTVNMNSTRPSLLNERSFEIDERDIPTSPYDGQSLGFNINMNSVHTSTLDEPNFEIDSSEIKELTFDFGNNDARPGENAETTFEQGRSSESCFSFMSGNQQPSHIADNRLGVSAGRMDDFCMGKVGNMVSPSTVEELDFGVDKDLWKNELIMSLGRNQRGLDVEQVMPFEQRKSSETSSFVLPRNEQQIVFGNNFMEGGNNPMDNLHQGRISATNLLYSSRKKQKNESREKKALNSSREKLKSNEVRNSWSNELFMGLGNSQAGQDVDVNRNFVTNRNYAGDVNSNFTSHSIDFARNDHPCGVQNNIPGICNSPAQMHNQENDFRSSLFAPYSNDQIYGVGSNSKGLHPDNLWEGQQLRNIQSSRDNEPMIGFSSSLPRPVATVMNDGAWRTNAQIGIQTGGLMRSSDCFAPFDFISNKGDNEYLNTSEKFDNISGFGGMQSNNYEQMEYNFFTPQTNALPGDSSLWLGKDDMMPKAANRNQSPAQCLFCGAGFHPEVFHSGTQTGSIAYICPTCKAGQLNVP